MPFSPFTHWIVLGIRNAYTSSEILKVYVLHLQLCKYFFLVTLHKSVEFFSNHFAYHIDYNSYLILLSEMYLIQSVDLHCLHDLALLAARPKHVGR